MSQKRIKKKVVHATCDGCGLQAFSKRESWSFRYIDGVTKKKKACVCRDCYKESTQ